jgi:hypothetical protein
MLFLKSGKTISWNGYLNTYSVFYISICFTSISHPSPLPWYSTPYTYQLFHTRWDFVKQINDMYINVPYILKIIKPHGL